jgi:hypothetical protein
MCPVLFSDPKRSSDRRFFALFAAAFSPFGPSASARRWTGSDLESVELYPLHFGSEYLPKLNQIPLDPAPWSEQLDVRLVVSSTETVGPSRRGLAFADDGGRFQLIDGGA